MPIRVEYEPNLALIGAVAQGAGYGEHLKGQQEFGLKQHQVMADIAAKEQQQQLQAREMAMNAQISMAKLAQADREAQSQNAMKQQGMMADLWKSSQSQSFEAAQQMFQADERREGAASDFERRALLEAQDTYGRMRMEGYELPAGQQAELDRIGRQISHVNQNRGQYGGRLADQTINGLMGQQRTIYEGASFNRKQQGPTIEENFNKNTYPDPEGQGRWTLNKNGDWNLEKYQESPQVKAQREQASRQAELQQKQQQAEAVARLEYQRDMTDFYSKPKMEWRKVGDEMVNVEVHPDPDHVQRQVQGRMHAFDQRVAADKYEAEAQQEWMKQTGSMHGYKPGALMGPEHPMAGNPFVGGQAGPAQGAGAAQQTGGGGGWARKSQEEQEFALGTRATADIVRSAVSLATKTVAEAKTPQGRQAAEAYVRFAARFGSVEKMTADAVEEFEKVIPELEMPQNLKNDLLAAAANRRAKLREAEEKNERELQAALRKQEAASGGGLISGWPGRVANTATGWAGRVGNTLGLR